MRRTKIVCTIGPSSNSRETLRGLIAAGMDVARLNFSHGTHDDHRAAFGAVRSLAADAGRNVAILMDLQGPKMRTGKLKDGVAVPLVEGAAICITARAVPGDAACVSTTYTGLPADVAAGDRLLLADGAMELRIESVAPPDVHCRVVRGGMLGEHKGINLPGVKVSAPSLTDKDVADLEFGMGLGADYVALSFVRSPDDIRMLRQHIERCCRQGVATPCSSGRKPPGVVAKIERPEALAQIDEIIDLIDGLMVARGDLGIESDLDNVPQVQKDLIRRCNARGIPVITATQMLESMMTSPRPTRAEVSDVANAIYDGTDAVMLSGETAAGQFPVDAVRVMADIVLKADQAIAALLHDKAIYPIDSPAWRGSHSGAIAEAVGRITQRLDVARVVCFTQTGFTARAIARCRPCIPITAVTLSEETLRRCALVWGVDALRSVEAAHIEDMVQIVDDLMLRHGLAKRGDTIILTGGTPMAVGGVTNLLKLHTVGQELTD